MIPASYAQRRLRFVDRPEGAGLLRGPGLLLRPTGRLAVPAARPAPADVLTRHQRPRARFPRPDGVPTREAAPAGGLPTVAAVARDRPEAETLRAAGHLPGPARDTTFRRRPATAGGERSVLVPVPRHLAAGAARTSAPCVATPES